MRDFGLVPLLCAHRASCGSPGCTVGPDYRAAAGRDARRLGRARTRRVPRRAGATTQPSEASSSRRLDVVEWWTHVQRPDARLARRPRDRIEPRPAAGRRARSARPAPRARVAAGGLCPTVDTSGVLPPQPAAGGRATVPASVDSCAFAGGARRGVGDRRLRRHPPRRRGRRRRHPRRRRGPPRRAGHARVGGGAELPRPPRAPAADGASPARTSRPSGAAPT